MQNADRPARSDAVIFEITHAINLRVVANTGTGTNRTSFSSAPAFSVLYFSKVSAG
jgi:hypothetical protein